MQFAMLVGTFVVNLILKRNSGEFGRSLDRPLVSFGGSSHFPYSCDSALSVRSRAFFGNFASLIACTLAGFSPTTITATIPIL